MLRCYIRGMSKEKRTQFNMRLTADDAKRIEDLRRNRSPIPSATDLLRELIVDAHEKELGKGKTRR